MENLLERHEIECAHQAEVLMSLIQGTLREWSQGGPQSRPTLRLGTLTLGRNYADPFFQTVAGGLLFSSFDLARSAIRQGIQIVRYAYETAGVSGSSVTTAGGKAAALLALNFPTSENGWPCTFEDPLINAVLVAPLSFPGSFESAMRAESLVSRFRVGPTPLRAVDWWETDSSEAGICSAVDHLQRFIRSVPAISFPGM